MSEQQLCDAGGAIEVRREHVYNVGWIYEHPDLLVESLNRFFAENDGWRFSARREPGAIVVTADRPEQAT